MFIPAIHFYYSGHILTEHELEGLSALLDLYSKEAIAKIKLEIHRKQGENISREEVERLFQQHGLQQVADDFEGSIEKGKKYNYNNMELGGQRE